MGNTKHRLIVVSNRLPFVLKRLDDGSLGLRQGSGGLVTAMVPVLRNRGGTWIGWPGTDTPIDDIDRVLEGAAADSGYNLKAVNLSAEQVEKFYHGYSNEIIWPLFHDLLSECNFEPEYGRVYEEANHKYADVIIENVREEDFIWIHDYHLMSVGKALRERSVTSNLAFFLHIPFPSIDIFLKLPHRADILRALLLYDLIGFQTPRDKRNFIQCVRGLVGEARVRSSGLMHIIQYEGREVRVGAFPIGIDYDDFVTRADQEEVGRRAWNIHAGLPERTLILGVDRLDYTKGLPYRLKAMRNALMRYPDLHRKITFLQVVVPSRVDIPKYFALKTEIEQLVGEINGQFTQGGWVPIHYIFRSLEQEELLAYYRTCEIALITPLKDGMNLVAKEFCACSIEQNSVLILSEFAGAAAQLQRGALLVNPYDIEQVADTIHQACAMGPDERRDRMRRLRRNVRSQHIFWWVDTFMKAAFASDLGDFPVVKDYTDYLPDQVIHG